VLGDLQLPAEAAVGQEQPGGVRSAERQEEQGKEQERREPAGAAGFGQDS
jgi:hypothetical protein